MDSQAWLIALVNVVHLLYDAGVTLKKVINV